MEKINDNSEIKILSSCLMQMTDINPSYPMVRDSLAEKFPIKVIWNNGGERVVHMAQQPVVTEKL